MDTTTPPIPPYRRILERSEALENTLSSLGVTDDTIRASRLLIQDAAEAGKLTYTHAARTRLRDLIDYWGAKLRIMGHRAVYRAGNPSLANFDSDLVTAETRPFLRVEAQDSVETVLKDVGVLEKDLAQLVETILNSLNPWWDQAP